jgi:hypothetical protein
VKSELKIYFPIRIMTMINIIIDHRVKKFFSAAFDKKESLYFLILNESFLRKIRT